MKEKALKLLGLMRRANAIQPGEDRAGARHEEFYVDEEGDRYPSRILSMTEKELIVLAPVDQAGVPLALNPQVPDCPSERVKERPCLCLAYRIA